MDVPFDVVATLDPGLLSYLEARGVHFAVDPMRDDAGPTEVAWITSDDDFILLVLHAFAPVPAIDVEAAVPCSDAVIDRLVANLGGNEAVVTWRSPRLIPSANI